MVTLGERESREVDAWMSRRTLVRILALAALGAAVRIV